MKPKPCDITPSLLSFASSPPKAIRNKPEPAIITKASIAHFNRSYKLSRICRPPLFYLMFKVHKQTLKTSLVVICIGSLFPEMASRWLDYKLSLVITLCPSQTKDSNQILDDLADLGHLPSNVKLFTSDAVSMCTPTYIQIMLDSKPSLDGSFLLHEKELPPAAFPTETVISLLARVMNNTVFQINDCWFQQINGTVMGISIACIYATIYYSYHEETCPLFEKYDKNLILFYRCFIDDVTGICLAHTMDGASL